MSSTTLADLPGQIAQLGICAAIAVILGYVAYQVFTGGPTGMWERTPLSMGIGVAAAGGAVTALVFALIALWAAFVGLVVIAVIGWAIANNG